MLFDIHAHVQFNAFKDDADEVITRARDAGVYMVAPSSELSTSLRSIEYAKKYPGLIWAGVGMHPIHLKGLEHDESELSSDAIAHFEKEKFAVLAQDPHVVGIGEIGLDYIDRLKVSEQDRAMQEQVFRDQIEIALANNKPIIQHCRSGMVDEQARDAHEDALAILSAYFLSGKKVRGVAHCYSGNLDQARRYLTLGFSISFTGLITFNQTWDDVIKGIPIERIMTETDCPYMTPVPFRGQRNEPAYVKYVAQRIAMIKEASFEEVAAQTSLNAKNLFKLSI